MNGRVTPPDPRRIEQQYGYRYKWSAVLGTGLLCGALLVGTIWLALSEQRRALAVAALPLVAILVFVWRSAVINIQGRHRLIITADAIYMPRFWNDDAYTRIPFEAITGLESFEHEGIKYLQVWVGKRGYVLADAWLSQAGLAQAMETIRGRTNAEPPRNDGNLD